jgi:hypothetical protein
MTGHWQTIDTAPMDQTWILGVAGGAVVKLRWDLGHSGWVYQGLEKVPICNTPTHWMPLPDPPKEPESPEEFLVSLFRDIQKASTTEDIGTMTQRLLKKIDEYLKDWDARAS